MNFEVEYNKMRPYSDSEVPGAMHRILKDDNFRHVISYLYEGRDVDEVLEDLKKIKTVSDFQSIFSDYAVNEVIRKTSDGLTFSGIENLDSNKGYLFIANHRDIVLDSAIMQILLLEKLHKTSQITFGSNLMTSEFIVDLGKVNKMFTIYRGGSKIQMYRNALLHSKYIKTVITEENESVWIAQRDGRTKDGDDKTQASLIKMLTMGKDDPFQALKELNIVPVTISYEYEPCDTQKIQEQYVSGAGEYKKQENEDLNSVLNGIKNYKGRIHMAFGKPINADIEKCEEDNVDLNQLAEIVVSSIDNQIHKDFILRPINYIAYDLLNKTTKYLNVKYNEQEVQDFIKYVTDRIQSQDSEKAELKKMFFSMYAMPLINKLK